MSSYNMVNGVYANENAHLLREILREKWGFDGFVVTDWGADNDHTAGVAAGSNLVMPAPGPDCALGLVKAVREGRIPEETVDERLLELLEVALPAAEAVAKAPKTFDKEAHHSLAKKCAAQSIVLLENDGILPLKPGAKVAVIGDFAKNPRYQGAGSSMVNPTKVENLLDQLQGQGVQVEGFAEGFNRKDPKPDEALLDEAVALAKKAGLVLLCVGLDEISESEGLDRPNMELSAGQQALMQAVCRANPNVVLVLSGGSPFVLPENAPYRAAVHGYLGGQAGAAAMAEVLVGKENPSGKLNETWPLRLEDNPSYPYFPSKQRTAEYREGLYIGYRYYDTAGIPVRYPFGHGLSYTRFSYADLHANEKSVTFTLKNTGSVAGAEVAQVYVSCKNGKVFRPRKELKGFVKVFLMPGEEKKVLVPLDDKAFRYYNRNTGRWEIESADYELCVAASAADVRLRTTLSLTGTAAPNPYGSLPSYESGDIRQVPDGEFAALLGHPIPDGAWGGALCANDAVCQLYYAKSGPARAAYRLMTRLKEKSEAKGTPDLNILFLYNMPLRAMAKMSGGMMSEKMVDDLVLLVNGHFWKGLGRLIADFFRNQRAGRRFRKAL